MPIGAASISQCLPFRMHICMCAVYCGLSVYTSPFFWLMAVARVALEEHLRLQLVPVEPLLAASHPPGRVGQLVSISLA